MNTGYKLFIFLFLLLLITILIVFICSICDYASAKEKEAVKETKETNTKDTNTKETKFINSYLPYNIV